jgi:asparagine synthase (glutamine-hydrolysing)
MCGIAAYVGPVTDERIAQVDTAADRLRHRGPDADGFRVAGDVMFAHRRLAIVDVQGGAQPLTSEDGRVSLICNGEIYNHALLRQTLMTRHTFATQSDSEVIVHLYEELGPRSVDLLCGMFAFVLTDGRRVFAARDALGIKPLYVGRDDGEGLWFASEIKALQSLCTQIDEFPPGCFYTSEHGFERFYEPSWVEASTGRGDLGTHDLATALELATTRHLMGDVPVGVLLSGGLDSSLLAALARPHTDRLHTFTVGFDGSPDLLAASEVARHLGATHHERVYTLADMLAVLERVIYHLESYDPALIRSAIPCYFVSQLAAEHVKVVLCGEGADEIFAGYRYFGNLSDPRLLHRESVRILHGLHNINLQRADRMTMAHALEGRVPFLDNEFVDVAMRLDPALKVHRPDKREKWYLRRAFDRLLPDHILWRTKVEFAAGCGSEQALQAHCEQLVTDEEFGRAAEWFPDDRPATKEAFYYRRIFERFFPGDALRSTVGRWRGSVGVEQE